MNGVFQITGWNETPYVEGEGGAKKTHAKITQSYSGDITGSSETQYLMSYQSRKFALFVGFEVVTAEINEKSGCFTLQHSGKFEKGIASSHFIVVPDSGTGGLADIDGSGSFKSGESGQANYELTINI